MNDEELLELLRQCLENNARDDITGLLLYKDGNFMQMLEGQEAAVRRVHRKILNDPRHKGIITLLQGVSEERQFGKWSMALQKIDGMSEADQEAISPFLRGSFTEQSFGDNPHHAVRLLWSFKKNMR